MKRVLTILLLLIALPLAGQEWRLKVYRFSPSAITDIRAQVYPVWDNNQQKAALIEVSFFPPDAELSFDGIIGDPKWVAGNWLVYVPQGIRKIRLFSPGCKPLDFVFPKTLIPQSEKTYLMEVELDRIRKTRTLILPLVNVNTAIQPTWGLMLGICKRNGLYTKFTYDFRFRNNPFQDYLLDGMECDAEGYFEKGDKRIRGWFTDYLETSRLSITLGYMRQLFESMNHNAAYLYLGGGYGARKVVRQSFDGVNGEKQYVQVAAPHSFTGFEIETGVIFRLQAVAISAGVQTNQFRYVEANLGIGVMF